MGRKKMKRKASFLSYCLDQEKIGENEKYAFVCFCLFLGDWKTMLHG